MQKLKQYMLPIAMLGGIVFYPWMHYLTPLSPYLIFLMLVITYCKIEPREFKIGQFQIELLIIQLIMSAIAYFAFVWWDKVVATGVFICVFIPTATAAPVITGMLGGSVTRLVGFSLIGNLSCAIIGPALLAGMGVHPEMSFGASFTLISSRVFPLLILPIITALILRYSWKSLHDLLAKKIEISFYMWALALFIVVGSSISFLIKNFQSDKLIPIIGLALGSLIVCLLQFKVGRTVGKIFGDKVSGGQGLGQKNTVLAIWMALTYMDPLASIAPASYVAWQNIINSWQLMRHKSKQSQSKPK